jgi:hypothetical protein
MILGILTFLSALTISAVAIYYSVAGLAAIFAAAVIPIIIMGVALEVGKLVTAVWLHRYWSQAAWWLRTYLSLAVFILMFITSMGIFGFLSKAHIEQTSLSQEQVALIETLDDKETRSQAKIERWRGELDRLLSGEDVRVDSLVEKEEEGLDKIYARINKEKDALRADAKFKVEQQQTRIEQAQDRRDAEIAAAEKKFEGTLGGTKQYEDAVSKAKQNELSVASRAQKEILAVNTKLDEDLAKIDIKYADDIKAINDRIQNLRNQANTKTVDIDSRVEELEGFIETEQVKIDEVNEEKFGYEKEYRKLEAEVGPIKYIAEFIYGEQADTNLLEAAVRWVIIIIIFVFDPLAVLLLIASQYTFNWHRENKGGSSPGKPNQDPDPEPEPPYTDKEWNEAHRLNHEFDRAKKIAENVPPTLSKKNTDQYLIWPDVDPDNNVQPQEQTLHEMAMEGFRQEQQDYEQQELDFEAPAENNVEQWNEWVEAANKAAEESPEDDDDDAEFWESLTSEEQEAMRLWKAEDEKNSLKYQRKLYRNGHIEEYPWTKYLQPQPDFEDSKFKIMPDLQDHINSGKPQYTEVVDSKKKKEYLNWMEKEGKDQIRKTKEVDEQ